MKRYLALQLLLGIAFIMNAQVDNNYNLYFEDLYTINPAASTINPYYTASLNANLSQSGMVDAPRTYSLAISGSMNEKVGLGTRFLTNTRGAFQVSSWLASYGYNIRFGDSGHILSMALSAGVYWQNLRPGDLHAMRMDDPVLESSYYKKQYFMNELGLLYTWDNLRVGFSAPFVLQLYNHYIAHASYQYDVPGFPGLVLMPGVLYQYLPEGMGQTDISLKTSYQNFWIALNYRTNKNVIAAFGANYKNYSLAYAYEFNNKVFSHISASTHEIMFSYNFSMNLNFSKKKASYDKSNLPWLDNE